MKKMSTRASRSGQRELEALHTLGGLSYLTRDLQRYLHEVAAAVGALLRVDWVAITLQFDPGRCRVLASTLTITPEQRSGGSIHGAAAETVILTGRVVVVDDVERDNSYGVLPPGYRAYLGVPLRASRGHVLGTLCAFAREPRPFGREDRRIAVLFSERAATSVDNYQLYQELSATNAELERQVRSRDEFLALASHELRTPVTSLLLMAQGLSSGKLARDPEERRCAILLFTRQVGRLRSLIDDLLSVALIQVGRLQLQRVPMDLTALVRDELERAAPLFAKAQCEVTLRAPEHVRGSWDPERLAQVVANLVANAAKYGAGKPIEVAVGAREGGARLEVVDHGIGLAPQECQRIFEKYERAASGRPYAGLGLGLFIVRSIVEALGGNVGVQSVPGVETRFTVDLPAGDLEPSIEPCWKVR
jgi:signal transduction histidine kinase